MNIDKLDLTQSGLRMFLSQIAVDALDYLYSVNASERGAKTIKRIYAAIGEKHGISRPVVNKLMKNMYDRGFVNMKEIDGQGGIKRLYWLKDMDRKQMLTTMIELVIHSKIENNKFCKSMKCPVCGFGFVPEIEIPPYALQSNFNMSVRQH